MTKCQKLEMILTKDEMMKAVFWHCVDILNAVSSWLGVTYGEASWVTEYFQHKEVFVWTENSSREGWLWIHEARNFSANQKTQCKGCCGLSVNQLSPF